MSFSTDSLANPNMWVAFGLITAAVHTRAAGQEQEMGS
jgi:hypothetical protein